MSPESPDRPSGEPPLVGLGRGSSSDRTVESERQRTDTPARSKLASPDLQLAEAEPWWSRTIFVVVLLALGQALLSIAWSSRNAAWASLSAEGGASAAEWSPAVLRRLGELGVVPVSLAAALLASAATVVAARCVNELGGGRGAQLLIALGLMTSPLILRIGTGHAELFALAFAAQLFLLGLVRFHRLRSLSSAGLLGLAAGLVSLAVPLGWVAGFLGVASAVWVSPAFAAVALVPWLLIVLLTMRSALAFDPISTDGSLFSEVVLRETAGSWAESLSILGFGLPLLTLGFAGLLTGWRAPDWQRPILIVAGLCLVVAVIAGPTVETLATGCFLLAAVGAVRIGGQAEVRGRAALAFALQATLLLGLLTLPLGLPLLL